MAVTVNHSTPADGTFSATGATAWDANHTLTGVGTMAEQNANAVAVTGGTINNATIGATTPNTGKFTTLEATGTSSLGTASAQYIQAVGDALYPQVKAVGSGTNIPLVLQPKGTGALQAQLTDSTATGGNARGANAVDWQTIRSVATYVASGSYSTVSGGASNRATSTYTVVSGGNNNLSSGFGSVVAGGNSNISNQSYTFVGAGENNTASLYPSAVVAGSSNTAGGYFNFIGGGFTNSGTATAAVTTQSATMNATTAVTLSGSNANIKVGQYITGTSIGADTYVAAISGTSLTLSKAASGSSTSTLSFFTPHGVVVGGGNNQASGAYSFVGAGGDAGTAANRNVASGDWSTVGGGWKNTASGLFSTAAGGTNNIASGIGSFIGGGGTFGTITQLAGNTASGMASFIGAGFDNTSTSNASFVGAGKANRANGIYAAVIAGSDGTARTIWGNHVIPSLNPLGGTGTSQSAVLVLGKQTTDATATVLTCDGGAGGTVNQVIMPNNSAYTFVVTVIAGKTAAGDTKSWELTGAIKRGANAASTAIVGTVTTTVIATDAGAATWAITATADTTNGGLAITVTGQAATTIRWVAKIETTEMTF